MPISLPYRTIVMTSTRSLDQVVEAMQQRTRPTQTVDTPTSILFLGTVKHGRFKVWRAGWRRDSFRPIMVGTLEATSSGVSARIVLRWGVGTFILTALFVTILITGLFRVVAAPHDATAVVTICGLVGMLLFVVSLACLSTYLETQEAVTALETVFVNNATS